MTQHVAQPPVRSAGANGKHPPVAPRPKGGDPSGADTYFLGRYRVVEELGTGGMASVHLARMEGPGGFQKWVAIKRIHPHLSADESFVRMFLDEARIAARISHPNVATVFDLGKHGNSYWIAMEYLHGEPLRELMRRSEEVGGPMPPEIAARVIADAAEGLHAAHELAGDDGQKLHVVHRDVTPHNLFVTYGGATKVVDFGIAKSGACMSSTRAGTLKGKLAYMSPEQVRGEPIDRGTDIFALGVVLWELTTGRRLFRTDNDLGTLAKVRECDIPRPRAIVAGYPLDLESVVMKALSKSRGDRFATARELSRALQSLLMKRGLFLGNDEVGSYVQFLFRERIRKREARLLRAGNIGQKMDAERRSPTTRSLSSSSAPSLHTYVSDTDAAETVHAEPPKPHVALLGESYASHAPTVIRHAGAQHRTATAHARPRECDDEVKDEAETLVNRPPTGKWSSRPVEASGRALANPCPAGMGSLRLEAPRTAPHTRARSRVRHAPERWPVWAAAALSGALALVPAAGIFVVVSHALRPPPSTAPASSSSAENRGSVPPRSRPHALSRVALETASTPLVRPSIRPFAEIEGGAPGQAPPAPASRVEGVGSCMAPSTP